MLIFSISALLILRFYYTNFWIINADHIAYGVFTNSFLHLPHRHIQYPDICNHFLISICVNPHSAIDECPAFIILTIIFPPILQVYKYFEKDMHNALSKLVLTNSIISHFRQTVQSVRRSTAESLRTNCWFCMNSIDFHFSISSWTW